MTTHTASCKPELIRLGKCMLQGFVGGILAAMALILFCLIRGRLGSFIVVFWAAIPLVIGGFLGAIKAIPFWAVNCFRKTPLPVIARIIIGGVGSTSLWVFILILDGGASNLTVVISAGVVFLLSLPTSLLIGSRVRVGKFFTLALGGLPLRLICTIAILFCVLACAPWRMLGEDVQQDIMFRYFPLVYFSLSLYLTIKPPHKAVLLIAALSLNAPLGYALTLSDDFQKDYGWYSGEATALRILCVALLIAWAIFLPTARKRLRIDIPSGRTSIACESDPDHQCLGSRFAEWQQLAA